jgi:hypothetical protein
MNCELVNIVLEKGRLDIREWREKPLDCPLTIPADGRVDKRHQHVPRKSPAARDAFKNSELEAFPNHSLFGRVRREKWLAFC